jgi:hypothetical protein
MAIRLPARDLALVTPYPKENKELEYIRQAATILRAAARNVKSVSLKRR